MRYSIDLKFTIVTEDLPLTLLIRTIFNFKYQTYQIDRSKDLAQRFTILVNCLPHPNIDSRGSASRTQQSQRANLTKANPQRNAKPTIN